MDGYRQANRRTVALVSGWAGGVVREAVTSARCPTECRADVPYWAGGVPRTSRHDSLTVAARTSPMRSTTRILPSMTTPVPTRFTDDELALIDELVDSGIAESRSAVIRRGVHYLAESVRRAQIGASIAASYREQPQTSEDDEFAMASAIAMTEAEPW